MQLDTASCELYISRGLRLFLKREATSGCGGGVLRDMSAPSWRVISMQSIHALGLLFI